MSETSHSEFPSRARRAICSRSAAGASVGSFLFGVLAEVSAWLSLSDRNVVSMSVFSSMSFFAMAWATTLRGVTPGFPAPPIEHSPAAVGQSRACTAAEKRGYFRGKPGPMAHAIECAAICAAHGHVSIAG